MSQKFSLNAADIQKWTHNLLVFLAPVTLIYVLAVVGVITAANGVVTLADFIPNAIVVGAMVLYVLNAVVDILRKFAAQTTPPPAGPQA